VTRGFALQFLALPLSGFYQVTIELKEEK